MKSAWNLCLKIFPPCLKAHEVCGLFVPNCRYAAVVLNRLVLAGLVAVALGSITQAQTAHLSSAQDILSLPSPLDWPQAVAVDGSGNIYVADAYNKRVLKLTPSASGGFTQSTVGTGLNIPYGVAVDGSGNVYIADIYLTTLLKETPSGNGYIQSTIGNSLYDAVSVAVDKQGNVFGVEINNSFVGTMFKETLSGGTYTRSFIPVPGTHGVDNVAVDGNGNLFVNDGWDGGIVFELSPTNDASYTSKEIATGGGAVAVDAANDVYVAGYPGDITKLTPNGSGFTASYIPTNATYTPYGYFEAAGLAVDASGNLFFTDLYTYELIEEANSGGNFGSLSVGFSSYPVSLFFTFDTAGTLGSTLVDTQGAALPDFSDAGTGGCYSLWPYGAGATCEIDVTFAPVAAGVRSGAAELLDVNGNPFATGYVQGTGVAPLVNFAPGTQISEPIASHGSAVAVDAQGNLFTVAPSSSTAFKDTPAGGPNSWIETPIGSGLGLATGVAIDGAGNLYIADQTNREIVKETLTSTGYAQSVIADHASGLSEPSAVAVDESGNVYVSDMGTNAVCMETPSAGRYVQSVVPTGALNQPNGVAVDSIGAVYIADTNNSRVLKETPIAGGYSESTVATGLSSPGSVAVDGFGNVYISETGAGEVLKETLSAGTYVQSTMASGITPYGLAVDSNLNLYIAGAGSQLLVKVDVADAPALTFAATGVGEVSADSPKATTLSNAGNAALQLPVVAGQNNPYISPGFLLDTGASDDCPVVPSSAVAPGTLGAGESCLLSISFSPISAGPNLGNLTIIDNNQNALAPNYASQTITLQGGGLSVQPQTINFPAIAAQAAGTNLNLSATATSGLVVSFASLTPSVCTVAGSTASLIAGGTCTIEASQAGNGQYSAAANVNQSFMVNTSAQTITFAAIAAQNAGTSLNLSATASSGLTVSFSSTTAGVCTISGSTASLIAAGSCNIVASQAGNGQYNPAANVSRSFNVNIASQTINFPVIAAQNIGTTLTLTATASSGLTVSFSSTTPAICTVSGNSASLIAAGSCIVQASQPGNSEYSAAPSVKQQFLVQLIPQTITFPAIATQNIGASLNLSATASSGLPVTFTTTTPAVCTVSGNSASLIAGGNCVIHALQPGNNQYAAAPEVDRLFVVQLLPQTITGFTLPGQLAYAPPMAPIPLIASGGATGIPVTFTVHSGPGTIACTPGCALTITGIGTVTVYANQLGNGNYTAAPQVAQSIVVSSFLAPGVSGMGAGSVNNTSETLSATINPENAPTTYFFTYGVNPASPSSATAPKVLAAGVTGDSVSASLTGLQANTTYYYRLTAKNMGGQVVTPAANQPPLSFTTP